MKLISRTLLACVTLVLLTPSLFAQFTPGRVVVLQITNNANGGGGALVEFTSSGASGYSLPLPYNGATDNGSSIVFGNNSTLNHDISLSADGALIVIGGFANTTASAIDSSAGTASPRVVATVKYNGVYARPLSSTTALSANSIRSMTSDGFGNFWGNGNSGTVYMNNNTAIQGTGSRVHQIFDGNLYYSTAAGALQFPGLPTTASAGTLVLPTASMGAGATAAGYAFPHNPTAGSVAYLVDYNGTTGIGHFHNDGAGSWIWDYNLQLASGRPQHLAVDYSGATPVLYVTPTAAVGNSLYRISDPGPTAANAVQTTIGTAPAGTVFRGLVMAPTQPALPVFTIQPTNQTNNYGGTIVFGPVDATGANPNAWSWKKGTTTLVDGPTAGGSVISGATTPTLTISGISSSDAGTYFAIASNNGGSVSSAGANLGLAGSSITTQLASVTNAAGTTANFHVVSAGPPPLAYSWTHDGVPIGDGPSGFGGTISGSSTSTLTITGVQDGDAGSYSVTVTDNSTAQSTSTASLTVVDPPQIAQQPSALNKSVGASGGFTVQATGGALSYQWFRGATRLTNGPTGFGSTISGATSSNLNFTNIQLGDAAGYTVTITNLAGTITSDSAPLTVGQAPIITSISSATNAAGTTATLTVAATGTGPFTYTWKRDGTTLTDDGHFSGTGSASLSISSVDVPDARPYVVTVHNDYGNATATANMFLALAPFEGTATPGLIVYEKFNYPIQPYPGFPAPGGFINTWENIVSTYNQITGQPAYWARMGGPYTALEEGFFRDPAHSTSGQYPWPGIDCSSSNQWYWSSAPNNNHFKFGGVPQSYRAAYFSCILQIDQGSPLNSGGADLIAGFSSGDSVNGGVNVDNWMYKLCTLADNGGDGYLLGVFKGDGATIGVNGQWASSKHLNRGGLHFIVGCYKYNSGTNLVGGSVTNDDTVSLWIDPDRSTFGASELNLPAPDAGGMRTNWSTNAIISEFGLRGTIPPASKRMTDLRIGKTWASVTAPYYPKLLMSRTASDSTVNWPVKDSGYVLQTAPDLSGSSWTNIDPPYGQDATGTNNSVSTPNITQEYFRLYYPPR